MSPSLGAITHGALGDGWQISCISKPYLPTMEIVFFVAH